MENINAESPLRDLGLAHLDLYLEEIFLVPPEELAPGVQAGLVSVGDLAAASGLPLAEVVARLRTLQLEARGVELSCEELAAMLERGETPVLLDVRQDWEYKLVHLPGSLRLTELDFADFFARMQAEDTRELVTVCHHGVRSYSAAMYLRQQGLRRVRSLAGGLDRWAAVIDPSLPRY